MTTAALWTKHRSLAHSIATLYFLPGSERQDVEQEALIGLWIAARDYDPARGAFPAFAACVIHRRLKTLVTRANAGKHRVLTDASRVEFELDGRDATVASVVAREELELVCAGLADMTELERDAVCAYVGGTYDSKDKRTENALTRARRKLGEAA